MAIFDLLMAVKSMVPTKFHATHEMMMELETELFNWGVFEILAVAWRYSDYNWKNLLKMLQNIVTVS